MATKSSLVGMTAPSILSTEFSESAPFNVLEDAKYQNAITLIVLQIVDLRTAGIKFAIKRMKNAYLNIATSDFLYVPGRIMAVPDTLFSFSSTWAEGCFC